MGKPGPIAAFAAATIALAGAAGAAGAPYPERPVEIVVAFTAGAVADILGRSLADGLSKELGQRFIVVNKTGATGAIGTAAVARAKPDGYTLLFSPSVTLTVVPVTNKQAGYTYKSFVPICQTFVNQMAIVVRPDSPLKSAADLVSAARAKPGGVAYAHLGVGSTQHLAMVEFSQAAKVEFNAIPYKGDADVMQGVRGAQVDFGSVVLSSAAGSGLRILGLFGEARNPAIPDVPTMREQGFDVTGNSFGGIVAPAGLPAEIGAQLGTACKAAALGEAYARLAKTVFQPAEYYADGAAFAHSLERDVHEKERLLATLGELK